MAGKDGKNSPDRSTPSSIFNRISHRHSVFAVFFLQPSNFYLSHLPQPPISPEEDIGSFGSLTDMPPAYKSQGAFFTGVAAPEEVPQVLGAAPPWGPGEDRLAPAEAQTSAQAAALQEVVPQVLGAAPP